MEVDELIQAQAQGDKTSYDDWREDGRVEKSQLIRV